MNNITVYTKNGCPQCKMTKRFLNANNIDFEEHNVNEEPDYIDYLKGQGFQAVPVIEIPGSDAFYGFQPDRLKKLALV